MIAKIKSIIKDLFLIGIVTFILYILVDLFLGNFMLSLIKREYPKDSFRVKHDIYHHTLLPDYDGIGYWGPGTYRICTNGSGFKDKCENIGIKNKAFDIAIIGDSFTEGVGLPFEDTFVGMLSNKYPDLKIANLGVVSYSPSIYLSKLKELYKEGYTFKNVIVFVDIGDAQDEAVVYDEINGQIIKKSELMPTNFVLKLRRYVSKLLPLTAHIWSLLKANFNPSLFNSPMSKKIINSESKLSKNSSVNNLTEAQTIEQINSDKKNTNYLISNSSGPEISNDPHEEVSIYDRRYSRSAWTYNKFMTGYGYMGVTGAINKMINKMDQVYELTKENGATLSVGVYPWPGQIKFDIENSLQVQIWKDFCLKKCKYFYNSFPYFFKLKEEIGEDALIHKLYMGGDMHFNKLGNELIFQSIESEGL